MRILAPYLHLLSLIISGMRFRGSCMPRAWQWQRSVGPRDRMAVRKEPGYGLSQQNVHLLRWRHGHEILCADEGLERQRKPRFQFSQRARSEYSARFEPGRKHQAPITRAVYELQAAYCSHRRKDEASHKVCEVGNGGRP